MSAWLQTLQSLAADGTDSALITVLKTRGSTPREAGTRMVVTQDKIFGTIGGGQLEYGAVDAAREMLAGSADPGEGQNKGQNEGQSSKALHEFRLGPELQQCCGGVVTLAIETLAAASTPLTGARGTQTQVSSAQTSKTPAGKALAFSEPLSDCRASNRGGWVEALTCLSASGPCVLVSPFAAELGPTFDRWLLVNEQETLGSVGDDLQNRRAVEHAQTMLRAHDTAHTAEADVGENGERTASGKTRKHDKQSSIEIFEATGTAPGLIFELVGTTDINVVLFGAGHVGKALVNVLSGLPCHVTWVDSRADEFPVEIPGNVTVCINDSPEDEVARARPDSYFLVMTHSHPIDFKLCKAILSGEFAYLGLIGSITKRRRFEKNFLRHDIAPDKIARLTCPIGIDAVTGKHPGAIAVAVVAQILQEFETQQNNAVKAPKNRLRVRVRD